MLESTHEFLLLNVVANLGVFRLGVSVRATLMIIGCVLGFGGVDCVILLGCIVRAIRSFSWSSNLFLGAQ